MKARGPCSQAQHLRPPATGHPPSAARPGLAEGTLAGLSPEAPNLRLLKSPCGNSTCTPGAHVAHQVTLRSSVMSRSINVMVCFFLNKKTETVNIHVSRCY